MLELGAPEHGLHEPIAISSVSNIIFISVTFGLMQIQSGL